MISWTSPRHYYIQNREQLEAYKQLPLAQRDPVISLPPHILTTDDRTLLSSASLKGFWINGQFATGKGSDAEVLFEAILQSQTLELLGICLNGSPISLAYYKLLLKTPISTTLRLVHITGEPMTNREICLIGRALRFNSVIEELAVYLERKIVYEKYSRLLMYSATSNLRIIYNIPMNVMSLFCAATMLSHSKITNIWIRPPKLLQPKRRWRYLIGALLKMERDVAINQSNQWFLNSGFMNVFPIDERNFLSSLAEIRR